MAFDGNLVIGEKKSPWWQRALTGPLFGAYVE